ncbi:hypothetical protein JCM10212_005373 [Sporobolomyces blumeae]
MAYSRPYPVPPQPYASSPVGFAAAGARSAGQAPPPRPPPAAAQLPPVNVPVGTLPPGTIVNVGECQVVVERFLSEGGFAHVYLANSAVPLPLGSPTATTKHVLKRMAVPDKRGVHEVGKEVEVMRQLKNHPKIVNMIEASVADLPGGVDGSRGYEIYILMEWCAGGGIIDMMNTRLQNRMTESEILKIFADTVEAVAHMHYQSPPLIHRDLKVENILLTPPQTYKLCDFGSTTKPLPRDKVPTAVEGIQKIELEINKTTTLQYRAPELVDVWGRKGFDEKIDIWALGVLLYKLCYYTTPFEEHGPLAILNAQYKFPPYPAYSPQIRALVAAMLQEKAENRPNIYQVHEMTCRLRGVPVRLENKYASSPSRGAPAIGQSGAVPSRPTSAQPPAPTASIVSSTTQGSASTPNLNQLPGMQGLASQVSPMRRGRPGKTPGGSKDGWAAFNATSSPMGSNGSRSQDGFGDAFTPSVSTASKSPEVPLETQVELPSNMGMFKDLASPNPAAKALDTAKAAQKQGEDDDDERRRFESTFPALLDDDLAPFGPTSTSVPASVPPIMPESASVTSPKPAGMQLTGEAAGPPLPRRPPTASPAPPEATSAPTSVSIDGPAPPTGRPLLVERASQTSPHLLASWKNGSGSSASSTASQPPASAQANGRSGLRQSSIPEFDLSAPSPTDGPAQPPKAPAYDLLGDDADDEGFAASSKIDTFAAQTVPLPASPAPPPAKSSSPVPPPKPTASTNNVASKRMSFLNPSSSPVSAVRQDEKEREKFRPVRKSSVGLASIGGKKEGDRSEGAEAADRFPALPEEEKADRPREFEEVVEKEETGDSSDEETGMVSATPAGRIDKPSFSDDDDFAPRSVPLPTTSQSAPTGRPRFGAKASSQSLVTAAGGLSLASSPGSIDSKPLPAEVLPSEPPAASRSTTLSSVASSEGGGDIDLGPALSSIRKFAPSAGNTYNSSLLDEQDEDDFPPSAKVSSSSAGGATPSTLPPITSTAPPASTLPPLVSNTPAVATPSVAPSATAATGFVPSRPTSAQPPLVAPKPRKAGPGGINSLVSRYEGLGTSLTGGPPPIGSKPAGLRKDSTGSNASLGRDAVNPRPLPQRGLSNASNASASSSTAASTVGAPPHWASKIASPELAGQRFPDQNSLDQHLTSNTEGPASLKPSTPAFESTSSQQTPVQAPSSARVPFRPTPPPSSPQSARSRYSIAGPPTSSSTASTAAPGRLGTNANAGGDEEEERFAGVSNMKSRWESMAKQRDDQKAGSASSKRKSWAAV